MLRHLYEIILQRSARWPDAVAIGAQHGVTWRSLTGRQLRGQVDQLAAELADAGVTPGDRVVLWVPNHSRTVVYLFAAWKLGAVVVPFDREMNPDAGSRILASVAPRLTIVGYGERPAWAHGAELVEWWEPGTRAAQHQLGGPWVRPTEELAAIVFTSGTTGEPKGCMITHTNLLSQIAASFERLPLDSSCRLASILPLSHLFELTPGLLYPLAAGASIHYVPSRRGPDVVRVLADQRITHMQVVPQVLTSMGQAIEAQLTAQLPAAAYRLMTSVAEHLPLWSRRGLFWMVHRRLGGHLRLLACGGAPLPAEIHRFWERLGVRVVEGYGASECSPVVACARADGANPAGSVGQPFQGVDVRLGLDGELLVRGPNVMRGYWQDPPRTAEVLDPDGWYHTGDLASIDPAGNIRITGRAKDLIVLPSGMKVWPDDVETVLRAHAAVKDAAVIAVPSVSGGATLHAYLIPASSAALASDLSTIVAECNARLAVHQRVATVSWWESGDFPRTAMLKVRRHLLPQPAAAVRVESVLAADDPVGQAVSGVAHLESVPRDRTLAQLGVDSLGMVDLALALEEKTGKAIGDADLRPDMTVDQVRAWLASAPTEPAGMPGMAGDAAQPPLWPYTWGRLFRVFALPFDMLHRFIATRTTVLGAEHLSHLPRGRAVIFAGTHHGFADLTLVRYALQRAPGGFDRRLVVAAGAEGFPAAGLYARFAVLAFGLYPLGHLGLSGGTLASLARLTGAGNAILIFPQGQHARPEHERAGASSVDFRAGVGMLADSLDALVVPFGVAGTEQVMPAFLEEFDGPVLAGVPVAYRHGPLSIALGEPLCLAPGEPRDAFVRRLQAASFALTRQAEDSLAAAGAANAGRDAGGRTIWTIPTLRSRRRTKFKANP